MPVSAVAASTVYGAAYGLFPIGWLVLNIIFLYQLTVKRGLFDILRDSLARVAPDPRIQLILIAFAFGSFLEGMSGFGALRWRSPPRFSSNSASNPTAGGGLDPRRQHCAGGLRRARNSTSPPSSRSPDLNLLALSSTVGAQLVIFSLTIPFLIVYMLSGWRGLFGAWPAALVAGVSYAIPQFLRLHVSWPVAGRAHRQDFPQSPLSIASSCASGNRRCSGRLTARASWARPRTPASVTNRFHP